MTRYTEDQISNMKDDMVGKVVVDMRYESTEDYYVIEFNDGSEIAVRLMADITG